VVYGERLPGEGHRKERVSNREAPCGGQRNREGGSRHTWEEEERGRKRGRKGGFLSASKMEDPRIFFSRRGGRENNNHVGRRTEREGRGFTGRREKKGA